MGGQMGGRWRAAGGTINGARKQLRASLPPTLFCPRQSMNKRDIWAIKHTAYLRVRVAWPILFHRYPSYLRMTPHCDSMAQQPVRQSNLII